jgi:hypothetical protein
MGLSPGDNISEETEDKMRDSEAGQVGGVRLYSLEIAGYVTYGD